MIYDYTSTPNLGLIASIVTPLELTSGLHLFPSLTKFPYKSTEVTTFSTFNISAILA